MSFNQAIQLLRNLPEAYQQEVLHFIEFIANKAKNETDAKSSTPKRNGYGSLKGKVWMAPDFDAPLEILKSN